MQYVIKMNRYSNDFTCGILTTETGVLKLEGYGNDGYKEDSLTKRGFYITNNNL